MSWPGFHILQVLYAEKLKEESFPHYDIMHTVVDKSEPEKYPKNYMTCVNFFQVLTVMWNLFKKSGMRKDIYHFLYS